MATDEQRDASRREGSAQSNKKGLMADIGLTTKEIVRLLVEQGEKFVCCKERVGVSPLECGVAERRIPSSGAALAKQVKSASFRMSASLDSPVDAMAGKATWTVFLKAKFGARSPGGARRVDLTYEIVGPTPSQLLGFHEREKLVLASDVTGLPPEKTLETRADIL